MAKPQKKSPEQYQSETTKFLQVLNTFGKIVSTVIIWGTVGYMFYCIKEAAIAFAGRETFTNIGVNVVTDLKLPQWFGYVFGGSGIGYGLTERRIRRNAIQRLSKRTNELEGQINPERTSSMLTEFVTTGV
jgi:hypothetical protein